MQKYYVSAAAHNEKWLPKLGSHLSSKGEGVPSPDG